jgi:hypothetical protein
VRNRNKELACYWFPPFAGITAEPATKHSPLVRQGSAMNALALALDFTATPMQSFQVMEAKTLPA